MIRRNRVSRPQLTRSESLPPGHLPLLSSAALIIAHVCIYSYDRQVKQQNGESGSDNVGVKRVEHSLSPKERLVADQLWAAATQKFTIAAPRHYLEAPDLAAGYRIQKFNAIRALGAGHVTAGFKIAMTSKAIQAQFGLSHPTSGVLFQQMVHPNYMESECSGLSQGRVEGEIAFEMRSGVTDRNISREELFKAVRSVRPAIEVVNSRISDWDVTPFDFVADNSAAAHIVLGTLELPADGIDLASVTMTWLSTET